MSHGALRKAAVARKSPALSGTIRIPGDKSISHGSMMLAEMTIAADRAPSIGIARRKAACASVAAGKHLTTGPGAHIEMQESKAA